MASALFPRAEIAGRRHLERRLVEENVRDVDRVVVLLDGVHRQFFDWQLEHYRKENLKVILRGWLTKETVENVTAQLVAVPRKAPWPVEALLRAPKLVDFERVLPARKFAAGIRRGLARFSETNKLFYVEAGIDATYYEELSKRIGKLGGADREEVEKLVVMEMRIYNVLLVMRARLNYDVPGEDVRGFLVRGSALVPMTATFEPMLHPAGFEGILEAMPRKAMMLGTGPLPATLDELQKKLWERLGAKANAVFYGSGFNLGCLEAFYYIKRLELNNLIRVAELLRFGAPPMDIARQVMKTSTQ
jgi:vacuolar-type H+-ATPase subunit C/Vma6